MEDLFNEIGVFVPDFHVRALDHLYSQGLDTSPLATGFWWI